tara:strand:- start:864 stop:1394 length:531 start_codon:yes stop_codon:yes gene_type:complete
MLPYYFDIPLELSKEQKQTFLNLKEEYIAHPGANGKADHNLYYMHLPEEVTKPLADLFKIQPTSIKLHMNMPDGYTPPHTDALKARSTPLLFPITDNFAPTLFWKDYGGYLHLKGVKYHEEDWIKSETPINSAYFINTQVRHGLKNNGTRRIAVQVWFQESIEALYELHKNEELLA